MKNYLLTLMSGLVALGVTSCGKPAYTQPDAPIQEVPFTQVHLSDSFWLPRIETNRTVSIPHLKNVRKTDDLITSPLPPD